MIDKQLLDLVNQEKNWARAHKAWLVALAVAFVLGFFVGKAYRLPASTDGPRQIVSHSVLERATNVPFGRTGSGFGA